MAMQAAPAISIVPNSLRAVLHIEPGKAPAFQVTVDIEVASGWRVELVPSLPQGINPQIKLLRLEVRQKPPGVGGAIERQSLRYSETPPRASYGEVWLGDGDRAISARVVVAV